MSGSIIKIFLVVLVTVYLPPTTRSYSWPSRSRLLMTSVTDWDNIDACISTTRKPTILHEICALFALRDRSRSPSCKRWYQRMKNSKEQSLHTPYIWSPFQQWHLFGGRWPDHSETQSKYKLGLHLLYIIYSDSTVPDVIQSPLNVKPSLLRRQSVIDCQWIGSWFVVVGPVCWTGDPTTIVFFFWISFV